MDTESPQINEEFLQGLVEHSDPRLMAMVGMQGLRFLALQMPTEKFKVFIENAVKRAAQAGKQAGLQPQQDQDQTTVPQPAQAQ